MVSFDKNSEVITIKLRGTRTSAENVTAVCAAVVGIIQCGSLTFQQSRVAVKSIFGDLETELLYWEQ